MSPKSNVVVRCLGKKRCFWYDIVEGNTNKEGYCGYFLYLHMYDKKATKPKKIEVGKNICPYRSGMYNYCEPEFI